MECVNARPDPKILWDDVYYGAQSLQLSLAARYLPPPSLTQFVTSLCVGFGVELVAILCPSQTFTGKS
jgi:hypothetical protein